jgi:hypothetical protein
MRMRVKDLVLLPLLGVLTPKLRYIMRIGMKIGSPFAILHTRISTFSRACSRARHVPYCVLRHTVPVHERCRKRNHVVTHRRANRARHGCVQPQRLAHDRVEERQLIERA